ncbi:hypothetical protein PTSG_00643 [Salpingoeca rosetta]|uniref:JmjC domain-containing protein n=1 Tax=Salpingoeca rosetta (strain ATCC 50818 / BSB-021) TaxID=946362 RepID=F2TX27_SALR5|nr:uncharacterized protein PTSG_00643 [Salpingoeca rosetta]EGD75936.1 hypothetical protein PTSG_00643 [Salpingoeca rosetta]|eukprot:XP_004998112.1 hypothetical protein PTSG_00643 [Salpingoeca rosetta]
MTMMVVLWVTVAITLAAAGAGAGAGGVAGSSFAAGKQHHQQWAMMGMPNVPPSFVETRKALFDFCDVDHDGVLVEDRAGPREITRMFGLLWEFRDSYRTARSFLSHRDADNKQLDFEAFLKESITTLNTVVEKFEEMVEKTDDPTAWFYLGMGKNSLHQFQAAKKDLLHFLSLQPQAMPQVRNLAESLERDARPIEAINMFESIFDAGYARLALNQPEPQEWARLCRQWREEHANTTLQQACKVPSLKHVASKWMADLKAAPEGCERIDASTLDQAAFKELLEKDVPVILVGAQEDWAPAEDWTPENLNTTLHGYPVDVHLTKDGSFYTTVERDGTTWAVRPASTSMSFADFLTVSMMEDTNATAYLEYTSVHSTLPPLVDFISRPEFTKAIPLRHINFWAGPGATISCVHSDAHENILFQVVGEKEFVLFPPTDHKYLYYDEKPGLYLTYQHPGQFQYNDAAGDRRSNIGGVHLHDVDVSEFPLIAETSPRRCRVRQGEALYVPYTWHHQVESIPSSDCDHYPLLNIAVNLWFAPHAEGGKQDRQSFNGAKEEA